MELSVSEKRFQEGRGQRYMADGLTVRCQAVSKSSLRKARIIKNNPDLSSDDVWPEGQCVLSAEGGTFLCHFHGGKSLTIRKRTILDFMPIDLQEKMEVLIANKDYINREQEIYQILALNAQLYERLDEISGGGEDTRLEILAGTRMIQDGEIEAGLVRIKEALGSERAQAEVREELRANLQLLQGLTRTQVNTAKELRLMATADQVIALIEGISDDFTRIINKNIGDPDLARRLLSEFVAAVRQRSNARPPAIPGSEDPANGS